MRTASPTAQSTVERHADRINENEQCNVAELERLIQDLEAKLESSYQRLLEKESKLEESEVEQLVTCPRHY